MKLRNKKTGRVVNFRHIAFDEPKDDRENYRYSSLAQFNEEWEDVPKEPLIKDEKIRKAVRAWAEANDFARVFYEYDYSNDVARFIVGETVMIIEADEVLEDCRAYTIAELCGEEEE